MIFEITLIYVIFLNSTISMLWLHFGCKVPLFTKQTQTYYIWVNYILVFIGLANALPVFLPRTFGPWIICDGIALFLFVVRCYIPRAYFSHQLRVLLPHIVSPRMLALAFYLPVVLAPLQGVQLAYDILNNKYHTVTLTNDNLPDSVDLLQYKATTWNLYLVLIPLLALDAFQLYLFWIGAKGLRNDESRRNAMSIVILAFLISFLYSNLAGLGALLGGSWPSIFDTVIDPVLPIVICMPNVVKHTTIFQPALNRINDLTKNSKGGKNLPPSTFHITMKSGTVL